jgi:hypothetical protein
MLQLPGLAILLTLLLSSWDYRQAGHHTQKPKKSIDILKRVAKVEVTVQEDKSEGQPVEIK